MPLALTPAMLAGAYEYLRTTPPFRTWKLPHADEVEFHITLHRDRYGDHNEIPRPVEHCIRASAHNVKTTLSLLELMAHEMIHGYQDVVRKTGSKRTPHNAEFKRLAKRVCKIHGFKYEGFV